MDTSEQRILRLQETLGHEWNDRSLLRQAVTHSSWGNFHRTPHSERLEFLGDSVLDLVTAEWLMARHPDRREGFMSQCRAEIVCREALAGHARRLGIGEALRLSPKDDYLRRVDSVLADAFEAIVGAVYLDRGDIQLVRSLLVKWGVLS